MIEARGYQLNDVDYHFEMANVSNRPISCAPCASGKTVMQALIAEEEMKRGNPTAILTPRFELFNQTHSMTSEVCGWDNIALLRAGDEWQRWKPIHIVSWPTLTSRVKRSNAWFPDVRTVLVDECHLSLAPRILEALQYLAPKAFIHGYTATPARQTGKGLGSFYTEIKHVISVRQLIKDGYLCPLEYWGGEVPDLDGLRIRAGDYETGKLSGRCVTLVGDVVDNWIRLASDRRTLVFGVDIAHAEALCHRFRELGFSAECIHNHKTHEQRADIVERFRSGIVQILTNVTIASYGFDCPEIECVVAARPTKSIVLWIQALGRGARIFEGKTECMIIDHAGNTDRLGRMTDLFRWKLDTKSKAVKNWSRMKESGDGETKQYECQNCKYIFEKSRVCPHCGWELPYAKRDVKSTDEDLVLLSERRTQPLGKDWVDHKTFYLMLLHYASQRGYANPHGWAAHKYRAKTKTKKLDGMWPDSAWNNLQAIAPDLRVQNFINKQQQNYARRRSYAISTDKKRAAAG